MNENYEFLNKIVSNILKETNKCDILAKYDKVSDILIKNKIPSNYFPNIFHIQSLTQNMQCICGFHSLYNICLILKMFICNDIEKASYLNQKRLNRFEFWRFHYKIVNTLKLSGKLTSLEIQDLDELEPLERSHIFLLMDNYPPLKKLKNDSRIMFSYLDFGYSHFLLDNCYITNFMESLRNFIMNPNAHILCIFLAIVDHWATFFVRKKTNSENKSKNKYEFYFCDSRNYEFLNIDSNLYNEEGKKKAEQIAKERNRPINSFYLETFLQSLFDFSLSIRIIEDGINDPEIIKNYYYHGEIAVIFEEFKIINKSVKNLINQKYLIKQEAIFDNSLKQSILKELGEIDRAKLISEYSSQLKLWIDNYQEYLKRKDLKKRKSLFGIKFMNLKDKQALKNLVDIHSSLLIFVEKNEIVEKYVKWIKMYYQSLYLFLEV